MSETIDLFVSEALFENGSPAVTLKIQGRMFELNVWMRPDELPMLERVSGSNWGQRESIQIGQSGNTPAFWSSDAESISVVIGHDDESWDFGITLPRDAIPRILADIHAGQSVAADRPKTGSC
jgi:hypothetical protein